ncbi:MAG: sugar nucleotide-binding protein [Deinococcota bacterium]|nr:sugar nucleotide-binding protein [Deinococcota bacterium]
MNENAAVLVIGASGFLGRTITKRLAALNVVIPTHHSNNPFSNSVRYDFFSDNIRDLCDAFKLSAAVFAAAVETEPSEIVRPAMERFVRGCQDRRLVYLSSDAVFSGDRGMYLETDQPEPRTLYGRNLQHCEHLIAENCTNYCIIRPSYIYGFADGQLDGRLARTRASLQAGEKVMLFRDMFKSPLGVQQVAEAVIHLMFSDYAGTLHVAGERLSVFDFHFQAMKALGVNTKGLQHNTIPEEPEFPRDTSLDASLWQSLTNKVPLSIEETLVK